MAENGLPAVSDPAETAMYDFSFFSPAGAMAPHRLSGALCFLLFSCCGLEHLRPSLTGGDVADYVSYLGQPLGRLGWLPETAPRRRYPMRRRGPNLWLSLLDAACISYRDRSRWHLHVRLFCFKTHCSAPSKIGDCASCATRTGPIVKSTT
jgi:hypothetical protein